MCNSLAVTSTQSPGKMADVDDVVDKISQYKKYLDKYLAKSPEENKVTTTIEIT